MTQHIEMCAISRRGPLEAFRVMIVFFNDWISEIVGIEKLDGHQIDQTEKTA